MGQATHLRLVSDRAPALEAWLVAASASFSDAERAVVASALDLAAAALHGVIRRSGEPALTHALGTADVLLALRLDHEAVSAALLSPVLATASAAAAKIREQFGNTIASLAEGAGRMDEIGALTARQLPGKKPEQQAAQLEALRKMLLAMVEDVRVVLIKLADHTHELRYVIRCDDQNLRREVAELARDIFAPLANRLGIWQVKWELEDLALRALEPDAYKRIARLIDEKRADRERYIEAVVALLKGELRRSGIVAEVAGRPKHIFSIYKKMSRKDTDYEYIYDVRAVRILVDSVRDCYAALGLVHQLWSPIPKEFDDYIARPKANQYRSLHTAVIGPEGKAIEVQIRTHEMHQHSELGVAAHWRYKEGARRDHGYDEKIAWLRQILDWREDVGGAGELVEQFRTGVFDDVVYVLTPQGKVIALPKGATPVDFAYHVHTELGHRCRGARVDGVMVPLNTPLANGQRVEIHAAKQGGPSRDWLNPQLGYLQSAGARTKVRQWFNRQNHETAVVQGRALLEKELQRRGMTALGFERVAAVAGYARLDEFLADLGSGKVGPKQLALALDPAPEAEAPSTEEALVTRRARASARDAVLVVGVDKLLTAPARCCKPVPPDPIIGFVTRGRGVSVHRAKCVNVKRLDARRCVPAEWGQAAGVTFPVEIEIEAIDRTGLLRDISDVLSRERINVTATHSLSSQLAARMRFTLEVTDAGQLKRVLALIREVRGVIAAARR